MECGTATRCNTSLARGVDNLGVLPLGGGHRADDNLGLLEHVIVNLYATQSFVHTRNHTHKVAHRAHLLNLTNLFDEVVEVELIAVDFLLQTALLLLAELLLSTLHKRHHIAHTKDSVCHTLGVEDIECVHLLALGDEFEGLIDYRANRDCCTTTGVAIELGQYNTIEVQTLVELASGVHCVLTCHSINHKEGLGGFNGCFHSLNLLHHLLINSQATCRIDNHGVDALALGIFNCVLGNLHGVFVALLGVDLNAYLLAEDFELVDSCGTIDVTRHQKHATISLLFEEFGELARESGLTRALQTCNEDYCGVTAEGDVGCRTTHKHRQLIAHDFGQHLTRFYGCEHILTERLLLNLVCEGFGNLVVHIGINQCAANLFQSLCYIYFGDFALTFENLKRPL